MVASMDLLRLRYFVAVAEEGNVGRAARRLNMSQPPLSQRIRELEAELGCALFVRTPQGMGLTQPGEVLLAEARQLLANAEQARERVRRAAGERELRVGVLGPGEAALSAPVAEAFIRDHEGVTVRLVQGDLADPTVGLAKGKVDAAITFTPFTETGLSVRTLREDRCFAALPASDPLADRSSLVRADLYGRVAVCLPEGTDAVFRGHWEPYPSAEGPRVHSLDECLHAILWQRAVALMPEQAVRSHPVEGVTCIPVVDVPPTRLVLAWRRADRNPLVAAYVDAFTSVMAPGTSR